MLNRTSLMLAAAVVALSAGVANADPSDHTWHGNNSSADDQNQTGYNNGYNYGYDDGVARRERNDRYRAEAYRAQVANRRYERGAYYYGSDCDNDTTAGTLIGAVAGGLIGNQFGHGNGRTAATLGGVIIGGTVGNSISSNMNCNDRRYAMSSYSQGFDGRIGHRYRWRNRDDNGYGSFTPVREFSRGGNTCRDFKDTSYSNGNRYDRTGTACRHDDGNWYME